MGKTRNKYNCRGCTKDAHRKHLEWLYDIFGEEGHTEERRRFIFDLSADEREKEMSSKNTKCRVCSRLDNYSPIRNGLCVYCFSRYLLLQIKGETRTIEDIKNDNHRRGTKQTLHFKKDKLQ